MSIWTMTVLSVVVIVVLIFGYLLGVADGNERMRSMYLDEQGKRVIAERELSRLKRSLELVEEKLIEANRSLGVWK